MVKKRGRGRPRKVLTVTEPATETQTSADDARESLEAVISSYKKKSVEIGLHDDDIKSLTSAVDSLIRLSKEERAMAEQYHNKTDEELLKLVKKAVKVLKEKNSKKVTVI